MGFLMGFLAMMGMSPIQLRMAELLKSRNLISKSHWAKNSGLKT